MEEALSKLNIAQLRELLKQNGLTDVRRKDLQAMLTRELNLEKLIRNK